MKTQHPGKCHSSSQFTLIELIVVIAIMAILAGFSFAAFQGVKGHKGSEAGAQRVADMIALARQYAISENTRVALLLPDITSHSALYSAYDLPTIHLPSDSPGIMMQVCEVDASGNFVNWLDVGGWVRMPDSAFYSTESLPLVLGIDWPDPSDTNPCQAIIFQPNGTLPSPLTGAIYVKPYSVSQEYYDSGKARQYQMSINWLTGQTTTHLIGGTEWW